jgi:acyl-CoA synthetase (AMP-forming)/AMP-acid ligase II
MNIARFLEEWSQKTPDKKAIFYPERKWRNGGRRTYTHLTFAEIDRLSDNFAYYLQERGIKRGDRVLLFLTPSLSFAPIMYGLFKLGAVPVLIDPGMGRKNLLRSMVAMRPRAMIAVPKGHLLRLLFPQAFQATQIFLRPSMKLLEQKLGNRSRFPRVEMAEDETCAVFFTSGGTGVPKGVCFTHAFLQAQIASLQQAFRLTANDSEIPGFPFFCIMTLSMGMSSCLPDMNPAKPAKCNPQNLTENILEFGPSFLSGSPAIWERVADYCTEKGIVLPSVRCLALFGAPVSMSLHQKLLPLLPNGLTYAPYGATEGLPLAMASGPQILTKMEQTPARGTYLGAPMGAIEMQIIPISDQVIEGVQKISDLRPLPIGEVGEIVVKGPVVTRQYWGEPQQTALAKIVEGDIEIGKSSVFWHRMGDVGHLDAEGHLWFCGRKGHVLNKDRFSIPCEQVFDEHPDVKKSALVQVQSKQGGHKQLAIAVVRRDGRGKISHHEKLLLDEELKFLGEQFPHTRDIEKFIVVKKFPVDIRHNIKIDRQKLGEMISHHGEF